MSRWLILLITSALLGCATAPKPKPKPRPRVERVPPAPPPEPEEPVLPEEDEEVPAEPEEPEALTCTTAQTAAEYGKVVDALQNRVGNAVSELDDAFYTLDEYIGEEVDRFQGSESRRYTEIYVSYDRLSTKISTYAQEMPFSEEELERMSLSDLEGVCLNHEANTKKVERVLIQFRYKTESLERDMRARRASLSLKTGPPALLEDFSLV